MEQETLPDYRALCAELAEALERLQKQSVTAPHTQFVELSNGRHPIPLGNDILVQDLMTNNLINRARAALAAEAVGPSDDRVATLERELERERLRLAACGVVAMADTPKSAAEARKIHPEYHSGSLDDVIRQVDALMEARAVLARYGSAPRPIPVSERLNDAQLEEIARAFSDDPVEVAAFVCGARWAEYKLKPGPAHALPIPENADD